jgi:hypothetical protein
MSKIQNFINIIYRHPKAKLKTIMRFGGFISYYKMRIGEIKMKKASNSLPPIISNAEGYPIYFLTGKNYIFQTLFCAYSLVKFSNEKFQFYLIDDGTFNERIINNLNVKMPGVKIVNKQKIEENLNFKLPQKNFNFLRKKRTIYPHLKKLTDIHSCEENDFKLVLDSDMLFFEEPQQLIEFIKIGQGCIHMEDCEESYGYSNTLMEKLSQSKIPSLINVGVIGIRTEYINWDEINNWINILEIEEGTSYFLEQALSAMIIASHNKYLLDPNKYIVNPISFDQGHILHHYVDLSKKFYFEKAWRIVYG